ncbi:MAG: SPFH domain-containing protein [Clostridia bacterium]|nr:SPFH domain-containing protein [Clostridia bacterium]
MGLIKAIFGAAGSVLADQWKEFFYCDSIANDILLVKGEKRVGGRSSNTKAEDNIISNGAGIAVADGQCMIIVEQGKVVELCAEPGEYTWNSSSEPSIFTGSFGEGLKQTFKSIGKRFTYGGDTGKDQRVYYFNTKEILDNKFGTANPIAFRVVDSRIGFDVDVSLRCNGTYTFRVTDPIKLYTNVIGNVSLSYSKDELRDTMKTEFVSALGPALSRLSELELRPNQIPAHTTELSEYLNGELSLKWGERGIGDVKVAINPPTLTEEDQEMLKTAQKTAMYRDPTMAGATIIGAQADAMRAAASNEGGAMTGFMGLGMAMNAGGVNAQNLFAMGQAQKAEPAVSSGSWKCSCGALSSGNFCGECGAKKPAADGWSCSCGAVNKGKFCSECGAKKPAGVPVYKCDKCGWEPEKGASMPKFCPECGDRFNDDDVQ